MEKMYPLCSWENRDKENVTPDDEESFDCEGYKENIEDTPMITELMNMIFSNHNQNYCLVEIKTNQCENERDYDQIGKEESELNSTENMKEDTVITDVPLEEPEIPQLTVNAQMERSKRRSKLTPLNEVFSLSVQSVAKGTQDSSTWKATCNFTR